MKTAEILYNEYQDRLLSVRLCKDAFIEALTEYGTEQRIDENDRCIKMFVDHPLGKLYERTIKAILLGRNKELKKR